MENNEDTARKTSSKGARRATLITLVALMMGVFLMNVSFVAAETTYTPTSTTNCDEDRVCAATFYSGVQNVLEDGKWKDISKANSLKNTSAYDISFLEIDENYPMTVIDYNMTSITVELDQWSVFNEEVDLRIWKYNSAKDEQYRQDVKDGKKEEKSLDKLYKETYDKVKHVKEEFNLFDLGSKTVTYDFAPGDIIEFGPNSTTIVLQTANSENLDDTGISYYAPGDDFGSLTLLNLVGNASGSSLREAAIKFNISSIPNNIIVDYAELGIYVSATTLGGSDSFKASVRHIYSSYIWDENSLTYNTRPISSFDINASAEDSVSFISTTVNKYVNFTVKDMLQSEIINRISVSSSNLSVYLNASEGVNINPAIDAATFNSKEHATANLRPKLTVTYSILPAPNATITYPVATTYAYVVNNFTWTLSNVTSMDTCEYSLNGAANQSLNCATLPHFQSITSVEGSNTIILSVEDDNGLNDSDTVTFTQDLTNPTATISYPANGIAYTTTINHMNWSVTNSTALDTCEYSLDGATNVSVSCSDTYKAISPGDGAHTLILSVEDDLNQRGSDTNTFTQDTTAPVINVTYPFGTITNETVGHTLYFNWTATDATSSLSSCWYNYNNTNTTVTCGDQNTTFVTNVIGQRNLTFYANDSLNNVASTLGTWDYKLLEYNRIFNATSYETTTDFYILNMSSDGTETITASFWYNNTEYVASKIGNNVDMTFTSEVSHPWETIGNLSFYWTTNYGAEKINSSISYQDVQGIALGPCNATLVTPFINFTFKNEADESFINSTFSVYDWFYYTGDGSQNKTFDYVNNTEQESYSFCGAPNLTFFNNASITYAADGYPQRSYAQSADLTNNTLFVSLYLLASADGQYVTFQTQDQYSTTITGATVHVEKQILGAWTLIAQDLTDDAGTATFFLNPDDNHRITTTKESYTTNIQTIRPTQTFYTIVMSGAGQTTTDFMWQGINFNTYPETGTFLAPNTSYDFGFNVTSTVGNITACKIEVTNSSFDVIGSSVGCDAYGGNITLNLGTDSYSNLYGNYYINLGSGYQLMKSNDAWMVELVNFTDKGPWVFNMIKTFNNYSGFSEGVSHNAEEFNRITFFFIFLVIGLGLFTRATGMEVVVGLTMGYTLLLLWAIISVFSFAGTFEIQGIVRNAWLAKYYVWMITTFITWGYLLHYWRVRFT